MTTNRDIVSHLERQDIVLEDHDKKLEKVSGKIDEIYKWILATLTSVIISILGAALYFAAEFVHSFIH